MNNIVLQVVDLHKSFNDLEVLKGISFELHKGESLSIIGSSGSGKSTILRCINFLETPTSGDIYFEGERINWNTNGLKERIEFNRHISLLRSQMGIVFQEFNLWPHMTVLQNIIEAPVHVNKISKNEAVDTAVRLLKRYGLEDKKDAFPLTLSGGQKQRVAIIRSLAMNPKLILFDEVTSALDPELTSEVLKAINILANEEGMTMVLVTHEIEFAKAASTKTIFIDSGVILEQGDSNELLNNPKQERTKVFLQKILREEKEVDLN
ncbi:MAG: amino acid ABC transporter ATP-binding protein [bacterium]|nr:amino acid ABC transporter ATP-binding protein [bacterium]